MGQHTDIRRHMGGQIGPGIDRHDTRHGPPIVGVDRQDPGVRMGGADKGCMHHAGQGHIVDKPSPALQ